MRGEVPLDCVTGENGIRAPQYSGFAELMRVCGRRRHQDELGIFSTGLERFLNYCKV